MSVYKKRREISEYALSIDCGKEHGTSGSCFFSSLPLHFTTKYNYPYDGYHSNYPESFHMVTLSGNEKNLLHDFTITQANFNDKLFRSRTYFELYAQRIDSDERLKVMSSANPDLQPSFELIRFEQEKFDNRCLENNVEDCETLCHEANGILLIVDEGKYCVHYEVGSLDRKGHLPRG